MQVEPQAAAADMFDKIRNTLIERYNEMRSIDAGDVVSALYLDEKNQMQRLAISNFLPLRAIKKFDQSLTYFMFLSENPGYKPVVVNSVSAATFTHISRLKYAQWLIEKGYAVKEEDYAPTLQ